MHWVVIQCSPADRLRLYEVVTSTGDRRVPPCSSVEAELSQVAHRAANAADIELIAFESLVRRR